MQEKIRLLMEETGCEQGEAELALELAGNDLEKAIKTIGSLLRYIVAIKGKIFFRAKNLYGLVLIVVNTKTSEILRFHTVVSYNPSVYEHSPDMDWFALEKAIFSFRLDGGSLPDFTQNLEQRLKTYLVEKKEIFVKCNIEEIRATIKELFGPEDADIVLYTEELNLAQFRRLPSEDVSSAARSELSETDLGTVYLDVCLIEDRGGKDVSKLEENDIVLSQITDERDIAHYLAHLIGGKKDGDMVPIPAVVKKIIATPADSEVQVYFAPSIIGNAKMSNDAKIKIIETREAPWWKKIIPW
ncbi:MAG: hypothetical protein JW803_09700 [Endomicrobiales bacterium]|nr:hypothetical protein [Endomicrobiales bacterium]